MKKKIFTNAKIIFGTQLIENGFLSVENGKVIDIGKNFIFSKEKSSEIIDCQNNFLSPGFIDLHCHGGGGHDFMDGDVKAIVGGARMHLSHGTTSIYPTTLTSTDDELYTFFDNYENACQIKENMPNLMGIHLEGPYFSPKQCGAQSQTLMQIPSKKNYMKLIDKAHGNIARWSSAPEIDGALELGKDLSRLGIMASIAHSNATYKEVLLALESGYSHITHLYSAMSTITKKDGYRILGVLESAFLIDELSVEIIADGHHLPSELLKLIIKTKSNDSICLVTDSMRGAGMPEGPSILGSLSDGQNVIIENGVAKMPDRTAFAGSVATADRLVKVMVKDVGMSIVDAVKLMTINPAKFMNIHNKKGSIGIGKDADLLIFDNDINIKSIYIGGKKINI
ncbi:N-acetylglucosamine-6-phosphate deacetylase [Fusobacterium sp. PH5-44]|uniref:N-acetylglucosamine-6-phosphate deacetylase n=1 Tax=unclassified Fusobacterium TaxID=2648384 RepID=UPI003D247104